MRFTTGYMPYQQGWDLASLGFSPAYISELQQLDHAGAEISKHQCNVVSGHDGVLAAGRSQYEQPADLHDSRGRGESHEDRWRAHDQIRRDFRDYLENAYDLGNSSGLLNFDSTCTGGPFNTSAPAPIGQDFASFLYGLPASGSLPINN